MADYNKDMGFALGFALKALVAFYLGTIVISFLAGLFGHRLK